MKKTRKIIVCEGFNTQEPATRGSLGAVKSDQRSAVLNPETNTLPKQHTPWQATGLLILLVLTLVPACVCLCVSCASFPGITSARSWRLPPENKIAGTVWILNVEADMPGVRSPVEKESAAMLPLVLSEKNYLPLEEKDDADFSVELKLREREYIRGWKTVRSLAAEIYIRPIGPDYNGPYRAGTSLPIAAGRAVIEKPGSLSSSKILFSLIKKAAGKAIAALEKNRL